MRLRSEEWEKVEVEGIGGGGEGSVEGGMGGVGEKKGEEEKEV